MMQVTSDQWLSWLSLYFWPLLRVLALISTAPILSERSVPKRVKLGLAMMITFAIAPSLPANDVPVFSFFALWLAVQQILIGIALGLPCNLPLPLYEPLAKLSVCKWGCHLRRLSIRPAISICPF